MVSGQIWPQARERPWSLSTVAIRGTSERTVRPPMEVPLRMTGVPGASSATQGATTSFMNCSQSATRWSNWRMATRSRSPKGSDAPWPCTSNVQTAKPWLAKKWWPAGVVVVCVKACTAGQERHRRAAQRCDTRDAAARWRGGRAVPALWRWAGLVGIRREKLRWRLWACLVELGQVHRHTQDHTAEQEPECERTCGVTVHVVA